MLGTEIFERFLRETPVCVMVRAALEQMLSAEAMNRLFREHTQEQYEREWLFSSVVDVMSLVVTGVQPSVHAACQRRREEIGVSIKSFDNNLAERAIRPAVIISKNSYGNRSDQGADVQAILMSIFFTLKKRGHNPVLAIQTALTTYLTTSHLPPLPTNTTAGG